MAEKLMDDLIDIPVGVLFFVMFALLAFIVHIIREWNKPDGVLKMKEEWQGQGKMDEDGKWY